ncbi:MAG: UDP-N-acetylmuramoyl-L-alanyl-D-glutamate--2,6-diaminopimelate ligase [Myxococcota bacterium]|jgi:UDP-N-acetylmuramoyl-L-alanyl-D-glutamate--2,6-diaminopimelate ligase|nr:UDP-N-acetylmuramoyl-L-alanyl-D-glutamate--2,6-diaminopimelate ligase [Myxococcota bacterium]
MRLSTLLDALPADLAVRDRIAPGDVADPVIRGVSYDSRKVAPGDLFVALRGSVADGHDYLSRAIDLGAVALLVETAPSADTLGSAVAVVVPDSRRAMARLAPRFYGEPASEMTLVGVTGTNGKTSTSYLVESILQRARMRTGLIGTVEVRYAGEVQVAVNTTPESLDLQATLRSMCTQNVDHVVMEVSSHGLELERIHGCGFRVAAMTNLTQDHLDFHGDMDAYRSSKVRLFSEYLDANGCAVVNVDDPSAAHFLDAARERGARCLEVSRDAKREAHVRVSDAQITLDGSRVSLALPSGPLDVELPLLGDFNLENLVVAVGIAVALEIEPEVIAEGIQHCPQVPGRMEVVEARNDAHPTVVVDYAHTPDAVDKLLAAVRPLVKGRSIAVFGCGGDRDRAKRPLMAEAVAKHSDLAIATSDNPRTEDPLAILRDVEAGLGGLTRVEAAALDQSHRAYTTLPDRSEAIAHAVAIAEPEDAVVLAGKGHEDYQIVGTVKLPFDDRDQARRALRARDEAGQTEGEGR